LRIFSLFLLLLVFSACAECKTEDIDGVYTVTYKKLSGDCDALPETDVHFIKGKVAGQGDACESEASTDKDDSCKGATTGYCEIYDDSQGLTYYTHELNQYEIEPGGDSFKGSSEVDVAVEDLDGAIVATCTGKYRISAVRK
jgi:hypothetical protein